MKKVSLITRTMAKAIDFSLIGLLSKALPYPFGALLGLIYALIQDGLFQGQSLGKKVCRLRVKSVRTGSVCTIRESVIRNSPMGVATLFGIIPFWGWILLVLLGLPLMFLEFYLIWKSESGNRLGDVMADTHVTEAV